MGRLLARKEGCKLFLTCAFNHLFPACSRRTGNSPPAFRKFTLAHTVPGQLPAGEKQMRDAVSELGMFSRYAMESGEEGDGTDYGFTTHLDGIHRQDNPDADRIWDDAEPLAMLLAQEEQAELNAVADKLATGVEIVDEEGYAEPSYEELGLDDPEYDTGWLNREPPAWYTFVDMLADENAGCDWDGGLVTDPIVPGEEDIRQGGVIGLRRMAYLEVGPYTVYAHDNNKRPDNFRQKRQRITRPRKAATKAKEAMHMAIAA